MIYQTNELILLSPDKEKNRAKFILPEIRRYLEMHYDAGLLERSGGMEILLQNIQWDPVMSIIEGRKY